MLLQRERLIDRMHLVFVVCKPILAILLQRKRLIARMHHAFCKPILEMLSNRVLTPLKSDSKTRSETFGLPKSSFGEHKIRDELRTTA